MTSWRLFLCYFVAFFCVIDFAPILTGSGASSGYAQAAVLTAQQCLDYGYNSEVLLCSTCDKVGQILGEQSEAKRTCLECCINTGKAEKYQKAVFEYDKTIIHAFPGLPEVVKRSKELKLTVKRTIGGMPVLKLYKHEDDETHSELFHVESWNFDTFKDYLKDNFQSSDTK
jgi:hypothetical protein